MHIPDGFLSILVAILFWAVSVLVVAYALKRIRLELDEGKVPLMGVIAAAIFAGQMLNFSVLGGTSGHLLGAALATLLLGPWTAVIVMTSVVSVQAVIFQDGGILALGANIFNMAIVGVFVSYTIFSLLSKMFQQRRNGLLISAFAAAWGSIFVAALSCALQLALSATSPANIAIPAMAGIHALIGIGEGLITVGALLFVTAARKDLLQLRGSGQASHKGILISGLGISLALAVLSPLASRYPDGLEWVAEQHGFLSLVRDSFYQIVPDYSLPGISNPALASILAGVLGVIIVFSVALSVGKARNAAPAQEIDK
jgi:cobalt/nickel transport system permease protein